MAKVTSTRTPRPRVRRTPVPETRDPFINNRFLRLTPDPKTGLDRFWTTSYNTNGSIGVLIDEHGGERIYRFINPYVGFYSAAQDGDDTLWLCGYLGSFQRFTLSSGKLESFDTGGRGLVFAGMPYDKATGKLLAMSFPAPRNLAASFDTRTRRVVKLFEPTLKGHYMRFSLPLGDGTWGISMHLPGNHLAIWDPRSDSVAEVDIDATFPVQGTEATTFMLIQDDAHRVYFPNHGWWDPRTRAFDDEGPRPQREMTWFERQGGRVFGVTSDKSTATVGVWDMDTGEVRDLCKIPDCMLQQVNVTRGGKIVAVSVYGVFYRFDGTTGVLECAKPLDTDNAGHIDCLARLDADRVLGTTYITQRFWEANLKTRRGQDLGRAAPGAGEIMKLTTVGKHVYMAAYTGGELMKYDPARPARFPENPHVVADPYMGMRPVAICNDGRNVYYNCSLNYGHLGGVLTRYDTRTGLAGYAFKPLGDQCITSLRHDKKTRTLLAATTFHADCQSAAPTESRCVFARLRDDDLSVVERFDSPLAGSGAYLYGPLGPGRWLAAARDEKGKLFSWELRDDAFATPAIDALRPMPDQTWVVAYSGKPGLFVLLVDNQLQLWDMRRNVMRRRLHDVERGTNLVEVHGDAILYTYERELVVLDHILADL